MNQAQREAVAQCDAHLNNAAMRPSYSDAVTTIAQWRALAADRQAEIDRLSSKVISLQFELGRAENPKAPNLTSSERTVARTFLNLSMADRAEVLAGYERSPGTSGSLLAVLRYLRTA